MAETGITIKDGYMATRIDRNGHLIYEHDSSIDNVDFSLNSDGHLIEEDDL